MTQIAQGEEHILLETCDDFGAIQVLELGDYRFLEFGDGVEQSCVYMPDPSWLEYDYTRAMLLGGLCHPHPEAALFLGLGGGSLLRACLTFLPIQDAEVIELRPEVVRIAQEYLDLPDDERVTLRLGDARTLVSSAEPADLIFMDLYTDQGPAALHLAWSFLELCQSKLQAGGWLIINQWSTSEGQPLGAALLRGLFHRHYWELPVAEGNVVLLVPADLDQRLDQAQLQQRLEHLAPRLGYALEPLLENIRSAT